MLCSHANAIYSADGSTCPDCGDVWRAPYFLKSVIARWNVLAQQAETDWAKKRARKTVKDMVVGEEKGAAITPAVAALFTDDQPELGKVWKCEACHKAPRRHPDFANNWKWKTENGFLNHKCLGSGGQ